jgi:uncharacterized membrane protein YczE
MICIIGVMVDLLWDIVNKSIKTLSKMIGVSYNWELSITVMPIHMALYMTANYGHAYHGF